MHLGIIIIFNNGEQIFDITPTLDLLVENDFKVCLVNNSIDGETINLLQKIKLKSTLNSNIFILNNKNNKGLKSAVKAGARFLLNEMDFETIIYLESNILMYLKYIKEYFIQLSSQKESFTPYPTRSERSVLSNVFPFTELLKINSSF
tara:strand:+ start:11054 stop:11497 length:444 start_codon:yes stop_codon:yes gene_type:complete